MTLAADANNPNAYAGAEGWNEMSNKAFAKRFLKLQRDVFRGERKKQKAVAELRRVVGPSFALAIEALAVTPRILCVRCGRDFMTDEIGESGMCSACAEADTQRRLEE